MRPLAWSHYEGHSVSSVEDFGLSSDVFHVFCAGPGQWQLALSVYRRMSFGLPDDKHTTVLTTVYESRADAERDAEHYRRRWHGDSHGTEE